VTGGTAGGGRAAGELDLPVHTDGRGRLVAAEVPEIPFAPSRYFVIRDVPEGASRGGHEIPDEEWIHCVAGSCTVEVRRGGATDVFRLESPTSVLTVTAGSWIECRDFSSDAVLLVLCPDLYDPSTDRKGT